MPRPKPVLFTSPRLRSVAATLLVLPLAMFVTAVMPVYLPLSQVNSVVLPILLFPVTWLCLFLWTLLWPRFCQVWLGLLLLGLFHAGFLLMYFPAE